MGILNFLIDMIRIGKRPFHILLGNVLLLDHFPKSPLPPFGIFLRMADRVIFARILGNAGKYRTFGEIQLLYALPEIFLGCRLHTVGAGA